MVEYETIQPKADSARRECCLAVGRGREKRQTTTGRSFPRRRASEQYIPHWEISWVSVQLPYSVYDLAHEDYENLKKTDEIWENIGKQPNAEGKHNLTYL